MVGDLVGLYELKTKSSILIRRGGADANDPECPRKLCCEIGSFDFWVFKRRNISGKCCHLFESVAQCIIQTDTNSFFNAFARTGHRHEKALEKKNNVFSYFLL